MVIRKSVIVVTGSTGLVGSAVVRALAPHFRVVGFDHEGAPHPPPQAECVCIELTDSESIRCGLERVRYAYGDRIASVIHLAAYYDFSGEPSDLYEEVTVRGTEKLLRALQSFHVEQFLFSSTMLVHKPTEPGRPINEDAPLEAKWDYPQSKIDTENAIRERRGDIPALFLRIAGVYTDACDSIPLAHQIQRIYEDRLTSHVYPADTSRGQAFVHLDDVVDAICQSAQRRKELPNEEAILIGEPETYSYDRLQCELGRLIHGNKDWDTQEIPKAVAKTGAWIQGHIPGVEEPFIKPWMIDLADDHYELDIRRARKLLAWRPRRRLIDTVPRMIEALKADPSGWYKHHQLERSDLPEPVSAEGEPHHD